MTLPIARTRDEARLFLDLTPCACGSTDAEWKHGTGLVDGELASRYYATCADCGAERRHSFGLPPTETAGDFPNFGGREPSQLLDPGSWLQLADELASRLPPDDPQASADALTLAAAAVAEVIKFIPPGENAVPEEAFWTEDGRRVHAAEPGRFRQDRLQIVLDTYRREAVTPEGPGIALG
ncbi:MULTISPECIES: hypothetical protein [unclassified Kribbella]|uniref:hypothetical protein n=1 Tax=unclassified Kribbella TaxID=2644121 RepID=UPI00301B13B9